MAIDICIYAAPVPGGLALAAPPQTLAHVRAVGYLLSRHPQPVRIVVLAPEHGLPREVFNHVPAFVRRVATAAALPRPVLVPGPSGRWHTALVIWGWLLLLAAMLAPSQVLAGLWLALGYPLVRRAYAGWLQRWQARPADGLRYAVGAAQVVAVEHAGLDELAAETATHDRDTPNLYRRLAALSVARGLSTLAPAYEAVASGERPDMVWHEIGLVRTPGLDQAQPAAHPVAQSAVTAMPTPDEEEPAYSEPLTSAGVPREGEGQRNSLPLS